MIKLIDDTILINMRELVTQSKNIGEFSIQANRLLKYVQFVGKLTTKHYVAIEDVEWEGIKDKALFTSEDLSEDAIKIFKDEYGFRIIKVNFIKPNTYLFTSGCDKDITNTFKNYCENLLL